VEFKTPLMADNVGGLLLGGNVILNFFEIVLEQLQQGLFQQMFRGLRQRVHKTPQGLFWYLGCRRQKVII
jgi:hypothetical protein